MADFIDKLGGLADLSRQRAKRSEALLSQLYRSEIDPPFRVPHVPAIKMMAILSILAVVLFTATLFYKFNTFIMLREDVYTKQGNLESATQRRENLFGNLVNVTLNHAALEHSVFGNTSKMRRELIKNDPPPEQSVAAKDAAASVGGGKAGLLDGGWEKSLEQLIKGGGVQTSLGRLMAVVEQYPNIQSAATYQDLMASLVEMEDRIAMRRVEYNTSLREYNSGISKFPWYLLAHITDFGRLEYFTMGGDDVSAPVITKKILDTLNPLGNGADK